MAQHLFDWHVEVPDGFADVGDEVQARLSRIGDEDLCTKDYYGELERARDNFIRDKYNDLVRFHRKAQNELDLWRKEFPHLKSYINQLT
jgi:hypothetical protein